MYNLGEVKRRAILTITLIRKYGAPVD